MPKKTKKEDKILTHPHLSPGENSWAKDEKKAKEFINSKKMNPQMAEDLLTGKYGHLDDPNNDYAHRELSEELKDNPNVDEKVRGKALDALLERFDKAQEEEVTKNPDESADDFKHRKENKGYKHIEQINNHVKNFGASPEEITKLLDHKQYMKGQDQFAGSLDKSIRENEKIDPKTLKAVLDHKGDGDGFKDIKKAALYHDNVNETDARNHIKKELKSSRRIDSTDLAAHKHADPADKSKAIKALYGRSNANQSMVTALNGLPDNERDEHVNSLLGMTGGAKKDGEKVPDDDYNNWDHGKHHNKAAADHLAEHGKLSPEQAEHLIRHGTPEQKVGLFHNPNLSPENYEHIYKKFSQADDSDSEDGVHGYKMNDLRSRVMDDNIDDLQERVSDSARESAENDYSMRDHINEMNDADVIKINDEAHERHSNRNSGSSTRSNPFTHSSELSSDMVHQQLADSNWEKDYDWEHDNPNYDPEKPEHAEDNPKKVDFSEHPDVNIQDHPDFESNEQEAMDSIYSSSDHQKELAEAVRDKWNSDQHPDDLYEDYDEALQDSRSEYEHKYMQDELKDFLSDKKLLPQHIKDNVPEIRDAEAIARQREQARRQKIIDEKDKQDKEFLDPIMPDRKTVHEYGPGQHHHEMVKDYADANGGAVDIGAMNKMHPNLKDKWKEVFGDKGKITSDEAQQKIDALPKSKYNITYGKWGKQNMQNTNGQDQAVVRLDHSDDSMKEIESDPELKNIFDKINDAAQRSGHPTNPKTIAWARVDPTDKKHWFVDEMQSDFESSARDYLEKQGHKDMADKVGKIADIQKNWREALMNHVIKTAKGHGAEKISTHSGESKAAHTGADKVHSVYENSYKKIPRQLGFKASEADELPLNEKGKEIFNKARAEGEAGERFEQHAAAMEHHAAIAQTHGSAAADVYDQDKGMVDKHEKMRAHHLDMSRKHQEKAKQIDPSNSMTRNFRPTAAQPAHLQDIEGYGEYRNEEATKKVATDHVNSGKPFEHPHDKLLSEPVKVAKPHQGHTLSLSAPALKKAIEFAERLIKIENMLADVRSRFSMR